MRVRSSNAVNMTTEIPETVWNCKGNLSLNMHNLAGNVEDAVEVWDTFLDQIISVGSWITLQNFVGFRQTYTRIYAGYIFIM